MSLLLHRDLYQRKYNNKITKIIHSAQKLAQAISEKTSLQRQFIAHMQNIHLNT